MLLNEPEWPERASYVHKSPQTAVFPSRIVEYTTVF